MAVQQERRQDGRGVQVGRWCDVAFGVGFARRELLMEWIECNEMAERMLLMMQ